MKSLLKRLWKGRSKSSSSSNNASLKMSSDEDVEVPVMKVLGSRIIPRSLVDTAHLSILNHCAEEDGAVTSITLRLGATPPGDGTVKMSEGSSLLGGKGQEPTYEQKLLKSCVAEFIGTFYLVATIALSAGNAGNAPLAPVAIGFSLMVGIFALGHVSGAHFNPAVTLGVWIRGKIDPIGAGFYVLTQLVAAFLAAGIMKPVCEDAGYTSGYPAVNSAQDVNQGTALVVEFFFTFLLMTVILNTATTKATANNSFYGLAIGTTVTVGAYSCGAISGGAFNPAVGTALPAVHGVGKDIWVYWIGPIFGAAAASGVFFVTSDANEFD